MSRMLMAAAIGLTHATGAIAGPLDGLRWEKRVLLVFGQGDAAKTAAQRRALADEAGLADRELLIVEVPAKASVDVKEVGTVDAAALRKAYSVAEDAPFTVLLVGKDGGVKRRSSEPVTARDLFATIDAMPMRANEMRRG